MGYKWEVSAWVKENGEYGYKQVYFGKYLAAALVAAIKAKKNSGCVKLEWR
ncbi:hypothetical protein GMA3_46 [Gordonia phage GMA3]|uniref:Uncharacterized protein n=1 Tax=Gordonia phage GMA3 TaxID=1647284 RepID=A0A0K0NKX2_9CAUD|nr:hypothetical protein AU105_gp046 [Gordonia phage GMA3]AKL88223.1 hypothetical protein GMA3_46 [Gordonia phage GMA3]